MHFYVLVLFLHVIVLLFITTCNARSLGFLPGSQRYPGGGHGNPLQYSCLENPHGQRSLADYSPWDHKVGYDWLSTAHLSLQFIFTPFLFSMFQIHKNMSNPSSWPLHLLFSLPVFLFPNQPHPISSLVHYFSDLR